METSIRPKPLVENPFQLLEDSEENIDGQISQEIVGLDGGETPPPMSSERASVHDSEKVLMLVDMIRNQRGQPSRSL